MKIDIYTLLGKMKDYEAPNKIIYDTKIWTYNGNDYEDENGWCLFDEYVITDILRDEAYILETEVTLQKTAENCRENEVKITKLSYQQIGLWALEQQNWVEYARAVDKQIQQIGSKINKIIDKVNSL